MNENAKPKQAKVCDIDIEISSKFLEIIKTDGSSIIHAAPTITSRLLATIPLQFSEYYVTDSQRVADAHPSVFTTL